MRITAYITRSQHYTFECVRYGRRREQHLSQPSSLICKAAIGQKCCSWKDGLQYFLGLRSKDDDDDEMDSCYGVTKERKNSRTGISKNYAVAIYLV